MEEIERTSKIFKSIAKEKNVKIFSHHDCDGIASASILIKSLAREGINFQIKIIKQLTKQEISNIDFTENDYLVFLDLGSGQLDSLKDLLEKIQVLIIDHHETKELSHFNLMHLNPIIYGEDETSSSIISYIFAKNLNLENTDLIDLAVVGAIADAQDEKGKFGGLAQKVLEEAETMGKITVTKGLRLYGRNIRPIHKTLELTFDPFIPGISGSESNSVQFLSELGISIKENDEWKRLKDLTFEEQQKLASAIIIERLKDSGSNAEDIFGNVYTISGRPEELQDAREFATLVNACGRLGRSDIGIKLCLGDISVINDTFQIFEEYRKSISEAINWIRETKESVVKTNHAIFLLGRDMISETLIGTVTSIFLNSNLSDSSKLVFGLAETKEGKVKISARVSRNLKNINLREILVSAASRVEGEAGGHPQAAGALIEKGKEQEFINIIDRILGETIGKKED